MTIHLSCPQCGAGIEDRPDDLRRGFAICGSCRTIHRVNATGTLERSSSGPAKTAPPPGVRALEDGRGAYAVSALRLRSSPVVCKRHCIIGGVAGLVGAIALDSVSAKGVSLPLATLLLGALFTVLAALWRQLPAATLDAAALRPSSGFGGAIPREQIRQLYATSTTVVVPGRDSSLHCSVFAVLKDGRRRHVIGPVDAPETALYLEELLELRLGLYDLAVEGEAPAAPAQIRRAAVAKHEQPAQPAPAPSLGSDPETAETAHKAERSEKPEKPESVRCNGCGSSAPVGERAWLRGVAICAYCGTLTLLHRAAGAHVLLGTREDADARRRHTVEDRGAEILIALRPGETPPSSDRMPAKLAVIVRSWIIGSMALPLALVVAWFLPSPFSWVLGVSALVAAALLAYWTLARVMNQTVCLASPAGVRLLGRPWRSIPLLNVPAGSISAILPREQKQRGAADMLARIHDAASDRMARSGTEVLSQEGFAGAAMEATRFEVVARTQRGEHLPLIGDLVSPAEATELASAITAKVGIRSMS